MKEKYQNEGLTEEQEHDRLSEIADAMIEEAEEQADDDESGELTFEQFEALLGQIIGQRKSKGFPAEGPDMTRIFQNILG